MFEMAVLELKEAEVESGERVSDPSIWVRSESEKESELDGEERARRVREASVGSGVTESEEGKRVWKRRLEEAGKRLDAAMGLAGSEIDLSTRLDSRIVMLRDEIRAKKESLGI